MSVYDLLQQSMQSHMRAAELRRKKHPEARAVLTRARDFRVQALAEDPKREDPAWGLERVKHVKPTNSHPDYRPDYPADHDAMMRFYREQLGDE